jgi:ubiquinone/menaquinone biosynthesis C-methylase UbiE
MASNKEQIFSKYSGAGGIPDDGRENQSRTDSLEFHYTKKHLEGLIKKTDRVLEVSCAAGYYGFYYANIYKEYVGIDLFPPHIELFDKRIKERGLTHLSCEVGDAINLENIPDNSFDVVLHLGPMYHLPKEERALAFKEAARVCKDGGIIAFAYIVQVGTYVGACIIDSNTYPNEKTNECVFKKGTDNNRPDLFFYTMPEEMEEMATNCGLTKIKNLGTNFMVIMHIVNNMTDEQFEVMRPLYDKMASCESCTGMAGHALLVCRK